MKRNYLKLAGGLLAMALFLTGCGGGKKGPPDHYTFGDETLPAPNQIMELGEEATVAYAGENAQEEAEDQEKKEKEQKDKETQEKEGKGKKEEKQEDDSTIACIYSNLDQRGGQAAKEYVDLLVADHGCSIIDEEGVVAQKPPDFEQEEGQVLVGKTTSTEDGLFQLTIQWTKDDFTVTATIIPELTVTERTIEDALTFSEIVLKVEHMSPQVLNLEGETMDDYVVHVKEGLVGVDGQAGVEVIVYLAADHSIQGSYIVTTDGYHVYQLNRETREVKKLV